MPPRFAKEIAQQLLLLLVVVVSLEFAVLIAPLNIVTIYFIKKVLVGWLV